MLWMDDETMMMCSYACALLRAVWQEHNTISFRWIRFVSVMETVNDGLTQILECGSHCIIMHVRLPLYHIRDATRDG